MSSKTSHADNAPVRLSLIVAQARGGVIGRNGKMPWHLPSELAHFKRTTFGKPVLMGRKTWQSLHVQPLPGRDNLVLSRDAHFTAKGALVFTDFDAMCAHGAALAQQANVDEIMVIGGAALYALALPRAERIYLTDIDAALEGDAFFPALDETLWRTIDIDTPLADARDDHSYRIRVLERS